MRRTPQQLLDLSEEKLADTLESLAALHDEDLTQLASAQLLRKAGLIFIERALAIRLYLEDYKTGGQHIAAMICLDENLSTQFLPHVGGGDPRFSDRLDRSFNNLVTVFLKGPSDDKETVIRETGEALDALPGHFRKWPATLRSLIEVCQEGSLGYQAQAMENQAMDFFLTAAEICFAHRQFQAAASACAAGLLVDHGDFSLPIVQACASNIARLALDRREKVQVANTFGFLFQSGSDSADDVQELGA